MDLQTAEDIIKRDLLKSSKQWNLLLDINRSLNDIHKRLSFLEDDGIVVNVFAAGGCIRDSLLQENPKIKDLDFYVILNPLKSKSYKGGSFNDVAVNNYYNKVLCDFSENNKDLNCNRKLSISGDHFNSYPISSFHAIFEINSGSQSYPIDLIFSPCPIVEMVNDLFDFDICKVYMNMFRETPNEEKNIELLQHNIYCSSSFIDDVINKTITFGRDSKGYTLADFERSMMRHYPRIKEKYSDYSLCDYLPNIREYEDEYINLFKKCVLDLNVVSSVENRASRFKI